MTWLRLALANLLLSPITTAVNALLMSLGTASIVLLLLAGAQLTDTMSRDAKGIDLVLGAQGSPVQLILSAVYHADVPPGNIRLADARRWADDPRVASAIPLALGDSFRGFRIVGTTPLYLDLYNGHASEGRLWSTPMEAVVGSAVARSESLHPGSVFSGAHGLVEGGHDHEAQQYRVVGVLAPTRTVLDRLVLTSLESVWALHGSHEQALERRDTDHGEKHDDEDVDEDEEYSHEHAEAHQEIRREQQHRDEVHGDVEHGEEEREVTAMLLRYRTPLAALSLPREVNAAGALQGAAPAREISRVLQLVGVGLTALGTFAWVLVATAGLSIFAALYGALRTRRGELAMLRCLGGSRTELLVYLLLEGLLMTLGGVAFGFVAGHFITEMVGQWLASSRGVVLTGWLWAPGETLLSVGLLLVGALSAAVPALQAYRTDVAKTLAEG